MANFAKILSSASAGALLAAIALPAVAQDEWVMPRTEYGHPDLQGNWNNGTMTPVQRPPGLEKVLSATQVAALEEGRQDFIKESAEASDPDREAPPEGGVDWSGDPLLDGASGGTGGYNYFYIDAGDNVSIYNGEPRSSLVVDPPDGRIPELTDEAKAGFAARAASTMGQYDNPENRPMGERCLLSFGNNLGPPLLPNYFYNNNYTIVQTEDQVLIMTEMVHDYRVIRLGEGPVLPDHIRPWFGDSRGYWDGDTLVVETSNLPLKQVNAARYIYPGGSEQFQVTERFTRVGPDDLNYEFTVNDPGFYTASWSGEVPMQRMDELLYEYACHEANYSLFNVLSGARAEEERENGE
ncbi:MAG: hypothetical protein ACR2QR_11710 [Woeseiaceae bacterium]